MKKTIAKLLVIALLINFIIYSISCSYATSTDSPFIHREGDDNTLATPSNTLASDLLEDGKTSQKNGQSATVSTGTNMAGNHMIGVILGYLALLIDSIPLQFHIILSSMSITPTQNPDGSDNMDFWLTIERIVFNKVALFNINFFNTDDNYKVGVSDENAITISKNGTNKTIGESITKMYMICRNFAVIISLLVLIYIGIRMAISTVSSDKAKYKKMLMAWVESIAIMFVLVYFMVIVIFIGESFTNVFYEIQCHLKGEEEPFSGNGAESFEETIVNQIFTGITNNSGLRLAMYSIMYWVLVFTQFRFFYLYMKRLLMVGFLILISPLITITYSIDKAGDGQAQAFSAWLKEFCFNVLIQPLHAIIYLVFMFTAGEIAKYAPFLGLAFMLSLGTVEKMVKVIFKIDGVKSLHGLNKKFGK